MGKRNLYLFADKLPPKHYGGVEIHGQAFIDYFSSLEQYSLKVISKGVNNEDIEYESKKFIDISGFQTNEDTVFFFNSGFWIEDLRKLRKIYPNVLFVYRTGGNEISAAKLSNNLPYQQRLKYWVDTMNESLNYLITNSDFTENRLKEIGINESLMHKVVGGVNRFKITNKTSRMNVRFKAISVTRFVEYKGIRELIAIFSKLPEIDLYVFGDGPLFDEIIDLSKSYENIFIMGKTPNNVVLEHISNSDVYVQCSKDYEKKTGDSTYIHTEGMGRSILEAISLKIPMVVFDSGALHEIVNSDNGKLVEPNDLLGFIDSIRDIFNYKDELYKLDYEKYYFDNFFKEYERIFKMKKVLIITSKFPYRFNDVDGGNLLVDKLLSLLGDKCVLDICFTRNQKNTEELNVRKILYIPNEISEENKFQRRIKNYEIYADLMRSIIKSYNKVIMIHASKAFGLTKDDMKNVIMFPMFLGTSYQKSNEAVPKHYFELEIEFLKKVDRFSTPSAIEYNQLVNEYGISPNKVHIIPRGIDEVFERSIRESKPNNQGITLIYIGSIKKQKNTLESLKLLKRLKEKYSHVKLVIVGKIQDKNYNANVIEYIDNNNLSKHVEHYYSLTKKEINQKILESDICISTSNWETFGRGVVEAAYTGIPTVAFKKVDCYHKMFGDNKGVLLSENLDEMILQISLLIDNKNDYNRQSKRAIESTYIYDSKIVDEMLLELILEGR